METGFHLNARAKTPLEMRPMLLSGQDCDRWIGMGNEADASVGQDWDCWIGLISCMGYEADLFSSLLERSTSKILVNSFGET